MNARMTYWLDCLAQREQEEEPGRVEILPPLYAENDRPADLGELRFVEPHGFVIERGEIEELRQVA